jgi:hypothetical protein
LYSNSDFSANPIKSHYFFNTLMGDAKNRFVGNPIKRYSVSNRSGLAQNADGSIDISLQKAAPAGHESHWLRVDLPGAAILDGEYRVPPVVEVK